MASAGAQRADKSARRLSEITDAAAKVFARRGYHGASTQDIADVLGMRQASLYYYFESKEAALEAVCVSGLEDYAKRALAIFKSNVASSEKVAGLVFQHLAPLAERLEYTVVFLRERRFLPQPARRRIRAIEIRYERLIERVIEQGVASGEFRRDLDTRMAALALLGLGNSAALWFGREPGTTVQRVARSYIDLLVRGFQVRH
ncbi:MAG TPA: TetR/AcrR family transcriptional regulator [Burkholderiales bacterium]